MCYICASIRRKQIKLWTLVEYEVVGLLGNIQAKCTKNKISRIFMPQEVETSGGVCEVLIGFRVAVANLCDSRLLCCAVAYRWQLFPRNRVDLIKDPVIEG